MIRTEDIRKLSEFRQNATTHLDRLAKSGRVEVLTVNGEAKGVVMSPKTFDDLAEKAFQAEVAVKIKRGMEEIEAGQGIGSFQAAQEIAAEFGIARDK
jgi:PHD/YefM family antitoxin component YafN of YafNO toxin-antitoxin module